MNMMSPYSLTNIRYIDRIYFSVIIIALCSGIFKYSNLAVRKPSYMSSGGDNSYTGARLSNDGNMFCGEGGYFCSISPHKSAPQWWAVDLESKTFVYGVNVTNRSSCTYDCF